MLFQFHKGTIRTGNAYQVAVFVGNFNSIKVRLELNAAVNSIYVRSFQFHKGTIRTQPGELLPIFYQISIP